MGSEMCIRDRNLRQEEMRHRKGTLRDDEEEGRRTPTSTRQRGHQEDKNEDMMMIMIRKISTAMKIKIRNEYAGNHMNKIKRITVMHKNEKRKKKKNIYDIEKFNKTNKRLIQLEFKTESNQQQDISMIMAVKCLRTREVRTRSINYRPRCVVCLLYTSPSPRDS